MSNLYLNYLKAIRFRQRAQPRPAIKKGSLCPKCNSYRQFHTVNCNWVRPDAAVILLNYYPVKVCPICGHHVYPAEMMHEYNLLKRQKVLV
jgi:ribosomal protein L32